MRCAVMLLPLLLLTGCAAPTANPAEHRVSTSSILASSTPANGAILTGPVDTLLLRFEPSARLGEVILTGPDGVMPMMVSAVGEVSAYAIPTPGLSTGQYHVDWKATVGAVTHHGRFGFTVR